MSNYGTNNHSHRDEENQALLNGQPIVVVEGTTFVGRTWSHVHHHRKRYFALWLLAAVSAISIVLGLFYFHKNKDHEGGDLMMNGKKDHVCESDRSYPITILLSIFFGYVGIDRFYLGYIISSLLKLATAGGLGIWYIVDIILIVIGALPDHNGCSLIAP
ncbi:hypothetical protein BGW39_011971 [Mortierella sp. 14UC]|nr:hypothetical protein BGW39_011971 [Mortierella sp. 14UC]